MPIAAKTMANSSPDLTRAWRMIWAASSLAGRPEPEKIGSFWPRTSVLSPSIAEMPVSMKSAGCSRVYGLIGAPVMSSRISGMIGAPPSIGFPVPFSTRPRSSPETSIFATSSRKRTSVLAMSVPCVPSNTWMTAVVPETSSTWPERREPSGIRIETISLYAAPSTSWTKMSGPVM